LLLIACTFLSLLIANTAWGPGYLHFWHQHLSLKLGSFELDFPLEAWINDGLMTIFFLLIGLEIERELYQGELSDLKNALLPFVAALGGMLLPALIHFCINAGGPTQAGAGIPMATDIAFSLAILSLLGKGVPASLKIFLTALAIIDDLGAIVVIGTVYTDNFSLHWFLMAMGIFLLLLLLNRLKLKVLLVYLLLGLVMWFFMLRSGVHATITGVLLAFAIPFGKDERSPSYRLQAFLHTPVSFIILPVFALANTGVVFVDGWIGAMQSSNSLGIMLGLVIGKPLGIFLFSYCFVKLGLCRLPEDLNWRHITGAGILAGIGFTMSIFITLLAFADPQTVINSKIAILAASLCSGFLGYLYLKSMSNTRVVAK